MFKVLTSDLMTEPTGDLITQPKARGDLMIRNASREDAGVYVCTADNDHAKAVTATKIIVECKEVLEMAEYLVLSLQMHLMLL